MWDWHRVLACLVVVAVAGPLAVLAQDAAPAEKPADKPAEQQAAQPAPEVSAEEIAALVKQLDADKFADRQAASERLAKIGKPAVEALIGAATCDSLEPNVRALDILKGHLESSDAALKDAAKAALEKIAKSGRPASARRAQDALKAQEEKERQPQPGQVLGGGIQIVAGAAAGGRRMSVRTVNGVKTIEVEELNQKTTITEDPKEGIKIEVTVKKDNGQQTTEKYEAKSAEELQKKSAKAYEIYKKFAGQGGVQIGVANVAVQPRRVNQLETATRILPIWLSQVDRMASDEAIKEASKEAREELKKNVGEAREQLEKLEKRLQEAIDKAEEEAKKKGEQPAEKAPPAPEKE